MEPFDREERPKAVPRSARKELLRSNIRSVMERTAEPRTENTELIISVEDVDPDFRRIEHERTMAMERARLELELIEMEMEKEFQRILSRIDEEERS